MEHYYPRFVYILWTAEVFVDDSWIFYRQLLFLAKLLLPFSAPKKFYLHFPCPRNHCDIKPYY